MVYMFSIKHGCSSCFQVILSATFHLCLILTIIDVFVEKPRKEALLNKVSKEQDILIAFEPGPGTNQASDAPKEVV